MGPTNNIGYLLQHLSGALSKQSDEALQKRLGIGFSQFKILQVLRQSPSTKQRQIAEWLGQTEASISRQIKIMIAKGLLKSAINPRNRREHLTTTTVKGDRLTVEAISVLNSCHTSIFDGLAEKQQEQLLEILAKMHKSACSPGKIGACQHPYSI